MRLSACVLPILTLIASLSLTPAEAEEITIVQKGRQFQPTELSVKAGTTLVFNNEDTAAHNVKTTNGPTSFDLNLQPPGEIRKATLDKTGTYEIGCDIHPRMTLTVKVQ